MTKCPSCGSEVAGDFGLVNCGGCGAMVMIDLSGQEPAPVAEFEQSETDSPPAEMPPLTDMPPPIDEASPEEWADTPSAAHHDLREIAGFGNSEVSEVREGSLRYNLFISGIDTAEIRRDFIEVIEDKKLMLDRNKIIETIHNGEIAIKDVAPIKCAILVQRLKSLPIQMQWEQYAIHQA
jgi:hypothetical protein